MLPNDPLFSLQWYLRNTGQEGGTPGIDINVVSVWDDYTGSGVRIGVFDDGVDTEGPTAHPDLLPNYDPSLQPLINGQPHNGQPVDNRPGGDGDNHGTSVAGIIAATANNGLGVVGIAHGAKFATVKVLSEGGDDPIGRPVFHQRLLTQIGFDVVNHSWGSDETFLQYSNEFEMPAMFGRGGLGTVIIKSAGNERLQGRNTDESISPPRDSNDESLNGSRHAIVVGALLNTGFVTEYSTPGANLLVSAPAEDITTDRLGPLGYNPTDGAVPAGEPNYTAFNGTSAAAPVVSGVAALMLQANPSLGWRDVQTILAYSARHVGSPVDGVTIGGNELTPWQFNNASGWNGGGLHFSRDYGFGLVDALAAVRLAETWNIARPTAQTSSNERFAFQGAGALNPDGDLIPAGGEVTRTFTIANDISVEDIYVDLQIVHPNVSELSITLTSPSGTQSKIWTPGRYITDPPNVITPFPDEGRTFSSREFFGESARGVWTLTFGNTGTNEATLGSVGLTTYGAQDSADDLFIYTNEFAAYGSAAGRSVLIDPDGVDTLNAAAVSTNSVLDLAPGGNDTKVAGLPITIHDGTIIENTVGGDGADFLFGNAAANVLFGGRGDDQIDGRDGNDTAQFRLSAVNYNPQHFGSLVLVSGPEGNDTLVDIESVKFADGTIAPEDGDPLVDTLSYLSRNPDVFHAGVGAIEHYNAFGWHEGRDPNPFFSTNGYLSANRDVALAAINPLAHYDQYGWGERRDPSISFDTTVYLLRNPDVASAGIDPLAHFLDFGKAEGRSSYPAIGGTVVAGFDNEFYLLANPDVGFAGVDGLTHYDTFGWREGRDPDAYFDTNGYLASYPDVAAAGISPLAHYDQFGWREGRDPSATFDTNAYLTAYEDVAAAHINPLQHFLTYGAYEGRSSWSDFEFG